MGTDPRNEAFIHSGEDVSDTVSVALSILGVGIHLQGHPARDLFPLTRLYADFRDDQVRPSWSLTWNGSASPTEMTLNGKVYPGLPSQWISPLMSMKVMGCVYEATHDFYMFHGAAAAWRSTLLVFPGESGSGKSSVSVALATRGWSLFSDELIAISRKTLRAVPFPRAVMIRERDPVLNELSPERRRLTEAMPLVGGGSKAMIPFSLFQEPPASLPPAAIVCLRGGRREIRRGGREILVTRWDGTMEQVAREKKMDGHFRVQRQGEFFRVRSDRMTVVEDICTSLGGIVIERDLAEDNPPVFGETPLLESISHSECLDALWSVFENGRTLTDCEGGEVGLYLQVARAIKEIPCFWLRPGPPSSTCGLLRNLAEELEKRGVHRG